MNIDISKQIHKSAEQNSNELPHARIAWLDYVRAIAILAVILCHSTEAVYSFTVEGLMGTRPLSQISALFLFTLGRLGVPLFLFLSGFLLLDRTYSKEDCLKFWKTKWFGLLLATEIWIVIYNFFLASVNGNEFSFALLLRNMLFIEMVDMGHMWYMPMILGLYLFLPFIATGLKQLDDYKTLTFPLCIICSILFVIPLISIFGQCFGFEAITCLIDPGFSGGVYGCYMLLGYCMKKGLFDRVSSFSVVLTGTLTLVFLIIYQLFGYMNEIRAAVWYDNGLLLLSGICLFVFFSKVRCARRKTIDTVSRYSFALYLSHFPILMLLSPVICQLELPNRFSEVLLLSCAVFVVSLVVCILISKIPKVGTRALYMR